MIDRLAPLIVPTAVASGLACENDAVVNNDNASVVKSTLVMFAIFIGVRFCLNNWFFILASLKLAFPGNKPEPFMEKSRSQQHYLRWRGFLDAAALFFLWNLEIEFHIVYVHVALHLLDRDIAVSAFLVQFDEQFALELCDFKLRVLNRCNG